MKKTFLTLILSLITLFTFSQISFQASYKVIMSSYPTYEKFRTSFNEYQKLANIYKEDLKKFGPVSNYSFVGSFLWEMIYAECGYGYVHDKSSVEYLSGAKRDFEVEINQFIFNAGFGGNFNLGKVIFYTGVESGVLRLKSHYFYPDGSISLGLDKATNRVFQGLPIKFSLGMKYFLKISEKSDIFFDLSFLSGQMKIGFDDLIDQNAILHYRNLMRYLPDDYKDYFDGGQYSGGYVQGDLKGLRFGLGLSFNLFDID